jgi:hypothetical protein
MLEATHSVSLIFFSRTYYENADHWYVTLWVSLFNQLCGTLSLSAFGAVSPPLTFFLSDSHSCSRVLIS